MDWPPQSPDQNFVAAVWDHLDRERKELASKEELWEVLKDFLQETKAEAHQQTSRCSECQRSD